MKNIVIVGGGAGGAMLANRLPSDEFSVTLIDKEGYNYYLPWLLYTAFKGSRRNIKMDLQRLIKPGVKLIKSSATAINLNDRWVELSDGRRLGYDYLVIATGASVDYSKINGLRDVVAKYGSYYSTEDEALRVWRTLNSIKEGTIAIVVADPKHRCPPSPMEGAFLAEEFIRTRGLRDKVKIVFATPYPRPYPAEPMNEVVEPIMRERGIDIIDFFTVDYVEPDKQVIRSLEGDELKYDAAIIVPPHVGVGIKYGPEDVVDEDGFVLADKFTNKVKGFDDAFVIGDASALPVAKTGVTAHLQAGVVARILMGEDAKNTGRTNCPFDLGYGLGTFVIGDYYSPVVKYPPNKVNHLMKMAFASIYWDMIRHPELWDPIFDAFFEATNPSTLKGIYG
ncbi:pyridine nucleotide-disulfide oxidoreductase [Thermocladium modestius]|uniref:Pyridine nucleotide-disulfide oxidoreductase n=1 Tax=Thermocladium modestius TaxID=62609 RepID=A0A830H0B8_9CREN|nr:FAD-dependent oxidoreductase [Thermocladium modestius]GGP22029.1 pyridine nucleotide-disulfide oxidoreductase [Thermocladium modestius]